MVLGGVAIGVRKQAEAAMAMPITIGSGLTPNPLANAIPIGVIRTVVAVLDMKFVTIAVIIKVAAKRAIGLPTWETTISAINFAAPVVFIAVPSGIIPANRKIVVQEMLSNASFIVMHPVDTAKHAPNIKAVTNGIILVAVINITNTSIATEIHIFSVRYSKRLFSNDFVMGSVSGNTY